MTITDKDREAAFKCGCRWQDIDGVAAAIAQARAEEREACAKLAYDMASDYECDWSSPEFNYAKDVEAAIRARGNAALPDADAASED